MTPIRILLADDHHLVRAGIRALLQTVDGLEVVDEARDGMEALRLLDQLKPDLVLMDVAMPGLSGLQALEMMRAAGSATKVIMLSMHANEEHVIRALSLGASGYVVKSAAPAELVAAIRAVMLGQTWLPAELPRAALDGYAERTGRRNPEATLTQRQRQVLKLLADGAGTREIASILGLSIKTIETYRAQIMTRLGIQDIPGLVRYAILHGISRL